MGGGSFGKRKRSGGSIAPKASENRPLKVSKHKRTWSMDSQNDNSSKLSPEEDVHLKLAVMQDMFSSTRPVSVLSLRGDEHDDPDLYPITLPGESHDFQFESLARHGARESAPSIDAASGTSNVLSPASSSTMSLSSPRHRLSVNVQNQRDDAIDWASVSAHQLTQRVLSSQPVKIQKLPTEGSTISSGFIEAVDIDPTYRPPAELLPMPSKYVIPRLVRKLTSLQSHASIFVSRAAKLAMTITGRSTSPKGRYRISWTRFQRSRRSILNALPEFFSSSRMV
jgi:hypothetical protein